MRTTTLSYIDVDILFALTGVISGERTVQEAFINLKESIRLRDEYKVMK